MALQEFDMFSIEEFVGEADLVCIDVRGMTLADAKALLSTIKSKAVSQPLLDAATDLMFDVEAFSHGALDVWGHA